jgi:histidinol-phosphatase (PHP family)
MKQLALAASQRGLTLLCFTDHCDLEHHLTGLYDPGCFDSAALTEAFSEAEAACGDKIKLRLGLELGAINRLPEQAREILGSIRLDLVIGSVHNFQAMPDFYFWNFHQEPNCFPDECGKVFRQYITELLETVRTGAFDVLGHIGYPLRYMKRAGILLTMEEYRDAFRQLFSELIRMGKGIEVNTAGLRSDFGSVLPLPELLSLYRQLGGEIITLGSDAHDESCVGAGIKQAEALIKELGYRYVSVFKDRKPTFIKL